MLDDKIRGLGKAAAIGGNPMAAGSAFEDIEMDIEALRKELHDHKA